MSHAALGFNITDYSFDQSSRTLSIKYKGPTDITNRFNVSISNFKNPVNQRPKAGFMLATLD